ncbi:MAG: nitroreductase family protein [Desulfobacterales bacterium]|nr:nitroreductase family protein [Desulfobacterales bacterium]
MKTLDDLIKSRRSIRKYTDEIPDNTLIEQMITSASFAPSPSNAQPVRFIRIISQEVKDLLLSAMNTGKDTYLNTIKEKSLSKKIKTAVKAYWRYSSFIGKAPILFAVGISQDIKGFSEKLYDSGIIKTSRKDTDLDITVGLALNSFILKGEELGLGCCILTAPLTFAPDIEGMLGISDIRIKCFVTAGFPAETPDYIERKSVLEISQEI